MRIKFTALAIILTAAVLLAGCTGSFSEQPGQKEPESTQQEAMSPPGVPGKTPAVETPDRSKLRPLQTPPPGLEPMEITPSEPIIGEVPAEIMEAITTDALERSGADRQDIQVVRAEAVVWSDGALGCPEPGEMYIQVLISGYQVVLEVERVVYDYRVSDKGSFKLCASGSNILELIPVMPVAPHDNTPAGDSPKTP